MNTGEVAGVILLLSSEISCCNCEKMVKIGVHFVEVVAKLKKAAVSRRCKVYRSSVHYMSTCMLVVVVTVYKYGQIIFNLTYVADY